jgi:hypothetical protein
MKQQAANDQPIFDAMPVVCAKFNSGRLTIKCFSFNTIVWACNA